MWATSRLQFSLRPTVDVLHHKPEQVLVPLVDKVPKVALEELLGAVEEHPGWLYGDGGDLVVRLEVGHHHGQRPAEGALPVEGALELQVLAVPLVLSLKPIGEYGHGPLPICLP